MEIRWMDGWMVVMVTGHVDVFMCFTAMAAMICRDEKKNQLETSLKTDTHGSREDLAKLQHTSSVQFHLPRERLDSSSSKSVAEEPLKYHACSGESASVNRSSFSQPKKSILVRKSHNTTSTHLEHKRNSESQSDNSSFALGGNFESKQSIPLLIKLLSRSTENTPVRSSAEGSCSDSLNSYYRRTKSHVSSATDNNWDIFETVQPPVYSVKIGPNVHITGDLKKVELRSQEGVKQDAEYPHTFPTGSSWVGHWNKQGMVGSGTYTMPQGIVYRGQMVDGVFHDKDATLIYPNGTKLNRCRFQHGKFIDGHVEFPDMLEYEPENWKYCKFPDRRYWNEVKHGHQPNKRIQATLAGEHKIPPGCYYTGDGYYNPKTNMVLNFNKELLRVPSKNEEKNVMENFYYEKREKVGYRPDLYEDWFNYDMKLIRLIRDHQIKYRKGEITYQQLNKFYADQKLLPDFSNLIKPDPTFNKIETDNQPKHLRRRIIEEKFKGHQIPEEVIMTVVADGSQKLLTKSTQSIVLKKSETDIATSSKSKSKTDLNILYTNKNNNANYQKFDLDKNKSNNEILMKTLKGKNTSDPKLKTTEEFMKGIVLEVIESILQDEQVLDMKRQIWIQNKPNKPFGPRNEREKCLQILRERYNSMEDMDEYCDLNTDRTCDMKNLSEDKYNEVKYWGKRIITLNFE